MLSIRRVEMTRVIWLDHEKYHDDDIKIFEDKF